jgi:hypothetical protein
MWRYIRAVIRKRNREEMRDKRLLIEQRNACDEGRHIFGAWSGRGLSFQKRFCRLCNYKEERFVR